jgi:hypothetical protein
MVPQIPSGPRSVHMNLVIISGLTCSGKTTMDLNLRRAICGTHASARSNQYSEEHKCGFIGPTVNARGKLLRWTGPEAWVRNEMVGNRKKPPEELVDMWPAFAAELQFPEDTRWLIAVMGWKSYHPALEYWYEAFAKEIGQKLHITEYILYANDYARLADERMMMYFDHVGQKDYPKQIRIPKPIFDSSAMIYELKRHKRLYYRICRKIGANPWEAGYDLLDHYFNLREETEDAGVSSGTILQCGAEADDSIYRGHPDHSCHTPFLAE